METLELQDTYQQDFQQLRSPGATTGGAWLNDLRERALQRFAELGIPTVKQEAWRFTNLRALSREPHRLADTGNLEIDPAILDRWAVDEANHHRIVLVDGRFRQDLSNLDGLPDTVRFTHLAAEWARDPKFVESHLGRYAPFDGDALTALNTAFLQDGVVIRIGRDSRLTEPLHILYLSSGQQAKRVSHPRTLIVAESFSESVVVETYLAAGEAAYWTNAVTELVVEPGARVTHYLAEFENEHAHHIHTLAAVLDRDSHLESQNILMGAALARNNVRVAMNGAGAEAHINGLFLGHGNQHLDNDIVVDHRQPHCSSHQNFRGILDDKSHGVFGGRIVVREDAQKTDSSQSNRNLLLSDDARVDTKPQLEIYADDVKCAHGATTGQLAEDALFYLESRGVEPRDARDILVYAFAHEIIEQMKLLPLRKQLEAVLLDRFSKIRQLGE